MLQLLWRANKELAAIDLARLKGDFGYRPTDPIMLTALEAPLAPAHTVADLIRDYQAAKEKKRRWSESTKTAHKPVYRLLRETFGASRDLATIGREDGRHLFDMIVSLPVNLGKLKALEGLTVPEAVEKAKKLGLPTISPKTINASYVTFAKAMFAWAVGEGWMDRNPLDGDYRVADDVADHEKRDPFRMDQLKTLFHAAPWDGSLGRSAGRDVRPSPAKIRRRHPRCPQRPPQTRSVQPQKGQRPCDRLRPFMERRRAGIFREEEGDLPAFQRVEVPSGASRCLQRGRGTRHTPSDLPGWANTRRASVGPGVHHWRPASFSTRRPPRSRASTERSPTAIARAFATT
jgi:hypothetical protein